MEISWVEYINRESQGREGAFSEACNEEGHLLAVPCYLLKKGELGQVHVYVILQVC